MKVVHLLCSLPGPTAASLANRCSSQLRFSLAAIVGACLSDEAWDLARLPVRYGGTGISDPVLLRLPACIASLLSAAFSGANALGSTPLPDLFGQLLAHLHAIAPSFGVQLRIWYSNYLSGCAASPPEDLRIGSPNKP